mgnify:CR=1 FL=1
MGLGKVEVVDAFVVEAGGVGHLAFDEVAAVVEGGVLMVGVGLAALELGHTVLELFFQVSAPVESGQYQQLFFPVVFEGGVGVDDKFFGCFEQPGHELVDFVARIAFTGENVLEYHLLIEGANAFLAVVLE